MNKDWKKLKLSSSGLPTWDSFIPYILEILNNGEETTRKVIVDRVLDYLGLPDDLRSKEYSKSESGQSILANRIGFALADLYKANAINRPKRAVYQITEKGNSLLTKYGDALTTEILQEQPEHKAYMEELELRNKRSEGKSKVSPVNNVSFTSSDEEDNPQEIVERLINERNNEVEIELLNKLRETDPIFFEKLVVKLLDTMGYSGKNGNVTVTTQSNDGGID